MGQPLIRRVRWTDIPLGCVVLEGPRLYHGMVPELIGYPLITERLRADLLRRYQLGPQTLVTIADPSFELQTVDFGQLQQEARRWIDGLPPLDALKAQSRREVLARPDARQGLALVPRWEETPYTLTKDWVRSVSAVVRDHGGFGGSWLGDQGPFESLGATVGRLLAGSLPRLPQVPADLDIGIDVSYSMVVAGKAEQVQTDLGQILTPLVQRLGVTTWRLWNFSETVSAWPLAAPQPRETRFAPLLRRLLDQDRPEVPHLCVVVTDGQCRDRPETLRLLERFARQGIEYLQLVLLGDDDGRRYVEGADGRARDGVVAEVDLEEGHRVVTRTDEEWQVYQSEELAQITDLAEAAHGSQLVVTWSPLFRVVALDVYERYLGKILLSGVR